MEVLIALLMVGLMFGLPVVIIAVAWNQAKKRRATWAHTAQKLGLQFSERAVFGALEGQEVGMRLVTRGSGKNRTTWTVFSAPLHPPVDMGLKVRNRSTIIDDIGAALGGQDLHIGRPDFDHSFVVQGDEPYRVMRLLTPELQDLLMATQRTGYSVRLHDGGVQFERQVSERQQNLCEWLLYQVARAGRAVDRARVNVPGASALGTTHRAWKHYADSMGLALQATPLCMWGTVEGNLIRAYATRKGPNVFGMDVDVRFENLLPFTISVRAKGALDSIALFFGAQDIAVGDPVFDDLFIVKSDRPDLAVRVLSPEVRRQLVQLHAVHPVHLQTEGLVVSATSVHLVTELGDLVHRGSWLVDEIERLANGGGHRQRGAYR